MKSEVAKIVISLTSYPPRIKTVNLVIKSLLNQTVMPWKIVLWLAEEEFPEREASLPAELVALEKGTCFEIDWCENIRSYKKLIPALRKYPDCDIVTADDDIIYPPDALERLVVAHRESPADILSMWVRIITAKDGIVQPFLDWLPTWIGGQNRASASFDNYLLGGSPAYYPAHCLHNQVLDMKTAWEVCPNQDDLWFWAMAVMGGCKIRGVSCKDYSLKMLEGSQEYSLWSENKEGGNDIAMERLLSRYPEIMKKLSLLHSPMPKEKRCLGGLIKTVREGNRMFAARLNIPLFQMKYSEDFSLLTFYILKIPVFRRRCSGAR